MDEKKLFFVFKNQFGKEYKVYLIPPPAKYNAAGLCENPHIYKKPRIWVDPKLTPRRRLAVLIEEVIHSFFWEKKEKDVRKISSLLATMALSLGFEYSFQTRYYKKPSIKKKTASKTRGHRKSKGRKAASR
jgi:hypothetical protein